MNVSELVICIMIPLNTSQYEHMLSSSHQRTHRLCNTLQVISVIFTMSQVSNYCRILKCTKFLGMMNYPSKFLAPSQIIRPYLKQVMTSFTIVFLPIFSPTQTCQIVRRKMDCGFRGLCVPTGSTQILDAERIIHGKILFPKSSTITENLYFTLGSN